MTSQASAGKCLPLQMPVGSLENYMDLVCMVVRMAHDANLALLIQWCLGFIGNDLRVSKHIHLGLKIKGSCVS